MRLRKVLAQNFGSIVDSGVVNIEDRVTVLIGKNEQGKTTFLKALISSSPKARYSPGDLPNHLSPNLEQRKASDIPIVTLWLAPQVSDRAILSKIVPDAERIEAFKIVKFYDAHLAYYAIREGGIEEPVQFKKPNLDSYVDRFKTSAEALRSKLNAHGSRHPDFAAHLPQAMGHIDQFIKANFAEVDQIENLVKTLSTSLIGVPAQDPAIKDDVAATIKEVQATFAEMREAAQSDTGTLFESLLPRFVFHSTLLDKIPNEIKIADFVKNPDTISKGMSNLCGVAGLSMQKIQELANATDTKTRERHEDYYTTNVSGGINEFWRQETYKVHFRFDKERMSVSISDDTYSPRIAPSDRSDGFQWYISFYAAIINEISQAGPKVFLLDNPGLELHADGQKDIKRFLEEKLPDDTQVIYVTHSPAMIDAFNLEQIRQVEHKGEQQGTKVGPLTPKEGTDFDLLDPARTAIGASLATSLVLNEFNVLVEGAADKPILEGALANFHKDFKRTVLVNGSLSETKDGFLPRFYQRANLPFVVFLDGDSRGRELVTQLKGWGIPEEKIVDMAKILPKKPGEDFALEDVLSAAFYHQAVEEAYPELKSEKPQSDKPKRTKSYESLFKEQHEIGFNKRRVGEQIKKLLAEGKADKETKDNLKKLTETILAALEGQITLHKTEQRGGDKSIANAKAKEVPTA